jgi:hypothetical protein
MQLSNIRGAANGKVETSRGAQESGARVLCESCGRSPQAAYSGEARVPKFIIQEGKKGIHGLSSVFMKIQPVTGFTERYDAEKPGEIPGIVAGRK